MYLTSNLYLVMSLTSIDIETSVIKLNQVLLLIEIFELFPSLEWMM